MVSTKLNSLTGDENGYTILLSHRPELFDAYVSCRSNPNHFFGKVKGGGSIGMLRIHQIAGYHNDVRLSLVAPNQGLFPKYDAGLYTDGGTNMVVSRGLGNSIIPIRFWLRDCL